MPPELAALQRVITDIHQLMVILRDPQAVAIVSQCLRQLAGLQKDMMQGAQQGPGGPPGGPPGPGGGGQQAMLQQLAGALGGGGGAAPPPGQ